MKDLDINNEHKCYLDEKELFILYYLLKNKRISTMWSNVFVPNPKEVIVKPEDTPEELFNRLNYRGQSAIVFQYLINLGRALDPKGFSIYCNADYATIEGGFLNEYVGELMQEYLKDTENNRKKLDKYKKLNNEQKKFLDEVIQGKELDSIKFSTLAHPVIKEYREAILNNKAEDDFIEVVNKLITDYDGGRWDTEDVKKFLEIWYRHNKEQFKENAMSKKTFLHEDYQTKVARLIFENTDIHLNIKNTDKLEEYLSQYINKFKDNKLDGICNFGLTKSFFSTVLSIPLHTKYFGYQKQKEILIKHIKSSFDEYKRNDLEIGNPYFEPEYIGDAKDGDVKIVSVTDDDKEKKLFLFVHTMLALEQEQEFKVEKFSYGTTAMFDMYDRGFLFSIKLKAGAFGVDDAQKKESVYFDKDKFVLCVNKKEIKVQKFKDQYHTLRIMFEEPNKEWFFSEISEKCDASANYTDKKFYNAIYQIKQKLKGKGIDDFFITTGQSVKINEKYLS